MLRLQAPLDERYTAATPTSSPHASRAAKAALGDRLFILGHHYQRDEVMRWADARGDSYRLSVLAQEQPEAEFIVFCGVHFMAESADILTGDHQQVILPDLNAGCSMADMADLDEVEEAWEALAAGHRHRAGHPDHLHELVGGAQGVRRAATAAPSAPPPTPGRSSSGRSARAPRPARSRRRHRAAATRCSSSPTSTSAATPGSPWATSSTTCGCGTPASTCGGLTEADVKDATLLLWKGHCSVHQRFKPEHVAAFRAEHPDGIVVAHPECRYETCQLADQVGSTDFIIRAVDEAPAGSVIGVGTEIHLVNRLDDETPDKTVVSLDPLVCPCSTMFRIDAAAPVLGARGPRRGPRRQPDHGRPRHDGVGQGRAPAHARDRLNGPALRKMAEPATPRPSARASYYEQDELWGEEHIQNPAHLELRYRRSSP